MKLISSTILIFLFAVTSLIAQPVNKPGSATDDGQQALEVLKDFKSAIINNNKQKASELLTKDARILESGGIETKEEYLSHHFHSDGKFLSEMERDVLAQNIKTNDSTAWISTTSQMSGTYNDREISINSAELAVFVKRDGVWKISAVHWSSRRAD